MYSTTSRNLHTRYKLEKQIFEERFREVSLYYVQNECSSRHSTNTDVVHLFIGCCLGFRIQTSKKNNQFIYAPIICTHKYYLSHGNRGNHGNSWKFINKKVLFDPSRKNLRYLLCETKTEASNCL